MSTSNAPAFCSQTQWEPRYSNLLLLQICGEPGELDKEGKVALLGAIKNGEIETTELTPESIIVSDGKDAFYGLMACVASRKKGEKSPVVFIGAESLKQSFENIKAKRAESTLN